MSHGRVPMELVFEDDDRPSRTPRRRDANAMMTNRIAIRLPRGTGTSDRPLSLPKLRSSLEALPETVYRCKGIVCLEELPGFRYVLQMVGKRYHLDETGPWGEELPRSEIVLIGAQGGIDPDSLQRALDACIGTGDESQSPILRLVRKIAPELLEAARCEEHQPMRDDKVFEEEERRYGG